ncbi:MAG TPA: hypothetical protein DDZ51_16075 [Planctomycetaceae bacterium]|nr:hypothetical protein [Planctomycetaceae bacterium]
MRFTKTRFLAAIFLCSFLGSTATTLFASEPATTVPAGRAITRVFIQDPDKLTLMWADLLAQEPPTFSAAKPVEGFPQLDPDRQSLVQMSISAGKIMVGVRDDEDGQFQSGWVLVDSGVEEEEHGDHSHWYYNSAPKVIASRLDASQGNPAHLYCYDGVFYLANDRIGGFTRLDPKAIGGDADAASIDAMAAFHTGGNGHITLAVAGDLAFSTWMSREEANAKRVDVTAVSAAGAKEIAYSFDALSGGLHGATYQAGKVFFAPANGINWISVPKTSKVKPESLVVHHIDLGVDGEKPRRTGAFTTHDGHVLFTSGSGESSFLGIIDARIETPEVNRIELKVDAKSRAHGPAIVRTRTQGPIAFLFHDHAKDVDAPNVATVIHLDPNRDGSFTDAKVVSEIEVGASQVEGHGGHHDMVFDAAGRLGVIANPGNRVLEIISTSDLKSIGRMETSFVPARLLSVGGRGPIRH